MGNTCGLVDDRPDIHYAKSGSVNIAYQVVGAGQRDLLAFPAVVLLPIDSVDEEPSLARFQDRLASFSRLIRFDPRGVGLSDPVVPTGPTTLEQWVQDAVAVLDAAGSGRTALFAAGDFALTAILLAATYPDRVSGLVIVNGTARYARDTDYPVGAPQRLLDYFLEANFEPEAAAPSFDFLRLTAPSRAHDESFRAWWVKAGRRGASPATARAIQLVTLRADVRAVLPHVRAPTLVIHRRDDAMVRVGHGRYLAEHLPEAKYLELEGADNLCWVGDTDLMLDEIEEFLTGVRHGPGAERKLTTILFTDIVGSTARLVEAGDRRWRERLDTYEAALRRQLERFGGEEVGTAGDGAVAIFDGPARAVTCGCAIRDAASQLGLELRTGIHTGEVEVKGADIAGLAVHVASRLQVLAEPGQVLVSRTVVDLVAGSGLGFADQGLHELRGIPGQWRLFSVES